MSRRRKTSGGQALVMVTLGLLAMCGLMGLVLDLGWMFYLKKNAQAAADAGALAAVEEAKSRMGGLFSGFSCPVSPTASTPWCQTTQAHCTASALTSTSNNLYIGCVYATNNGFTDGGPQGQQVWIQANGGANLPPTAPGVSSIVYWVTVRVSQTVPQLFSFVAGNTSGVISAGATAGVVSTVVPGQFIALNQAYNCINGSECGADFVLGGSSSVVAPGGVIMSSACNGASVAGCGTMGGSSGFASNTGNGNGNRCVSTGPNCTSNGSPVEIQSGGVVDNTAHFAPAPTSVSSQQTSDPLLGEGQPPLNVPSSPLPSCGINSASGVTAGATFPPMQYYTFSNLGSSNSPKNTPLGNSISVSNATFDPTAAATAGACGAISPGAVFTAGAAQSSSSFPTYIFYGGLVIQGSNQTTTFGPAQYVMVGALSGNDSLTLATNGNPTITDSGGSNAGTSYAGEMFITTAPGYSSALDTQMNGSGVNGSSFNTNFFNPNLQSTPNAGQVVLDQGSISIGGGNSANITLNGVSQQASGISGTNLAQYNGILMWQDRRNSTSDYTTNASGTNVINTGTTAAAQQTYMTKHLVSTPSSPSSPAFNMTSSANLYLNGVLYQPQGSWMSFSGTPNIRKGLQIITGAFQGQGGGSVTLLPTSNPTIRYITALIQ